MSDAGSLLNDLPVTLEDLVDHLDELFAIEILQRIEMPAGLFRQLRGWLVLSGHRFLPEADSYVNKHPSLPVTGYLLYRLCKDSAEVE